MKKSIDMSRKTFVRIIISSLFLGSWVLTGASWAQPLVDLDIVQFKVTKKVNIAKNNNTVEITLSVKNIGNVDEPRAATVTGVQNGLDIYSDTFLVSDAVGAGFAKFSALAGFVPEMVGDIIWTASIADDDPDVDDATATTSVIDK